MADATAANAVAMERQEVLQKYRDAADPRGKDMKGKCLDMLQYEQLEVNIEGNDIEQEKVFEVRCSVTLRSYKTLSPSLPLSLFANTHTHTHTHTQGYNLGYHSNARGSTAAAAAPAPNLSPRCKIVQ
jgi:hypothetical protein